VSRSRDPVVAPGEAAAAEIATLINANNNAFISVVSLLLQLQFHARMRQLQ
jgi:hypothetical protein